MLRPKLIVIAGPSGCGKTTIARAILKRHPELLFSVSATTRQKRSREIEGIDYFFVSTDEFKQKIQNNELVEWEQIYGDYYGTPVSEIERARMDARAMLFDIDVNGALLIKRKYPDDTLLIFIRPPSLKALTDRLQNRKTESAEALARRVDRAAMELGLGKQFDHDVTNDIIEDAIAKVDAIIAPALQASTSIHR